MRVTKRNNLNHLVLNESQESDSQKLAIKLLMSKGMDKDEANDFVRKKIRMLFKPLGHNTKLGKFTYGLTRMVIDYGLEFDDDIVSDINDHLPLLMNDLQSYDKNLNNLSPEDFIANFANERNKKINREKDILSKMDFKGGDYDVVRIDTFEDAEKYTKFTPNTSAWCLCTDRGRFDYYSCGGRNGIYFCLKRGFEHVLETEGKNCPFDEYGLSMLCVVVNRNSELVCCALRWNHLHGCNDNMMNAVQLSKVLNLNFYEYFAQNDTTKDVLKTLQNRLDDGESVFDVFSDVKNVQGVFICELDAGGYIMVSTNNKIITDDVYSNITPVKDMFITVSDNYDSYSFIDNKARVIEKDITYVDYCGPFSLHCDKFIYVGKNGKYNYFDVDNKKLISDQWFDKLMYFEDGISRAKIGETSYIIDKNGNVRINESMTYNNNILYISIDLDNESRLKLKSFCEPTVQDVFGEGAIYKCHHMTISHYSKLDEETLLWCEENNGREFTLYVDSIGVSDKAIAVAVDVDGVISKQAYPHITVAINPLTNGKPVDSNYITDFEDVYQNIELHGKLEFHYKGERDNTTLLESEIRKPIQQHINESWADGNDNPDIIDYLNDYQGTDFIPEELYSYDLRHWVLTTGDFLYAYDFPIGGLKIRAANTEAIIEDIANDLEECGYIQHTHEIDELLLKREDEFKNMYVAVYKVCDVPGSKDYYVVYQQER